jgi:probable F420-dependent oxidoreductase
MAEFIDALRAIWECWNQDIDLNFEGRHYRHTLMTPMFRPSPNPWGAPPIVLAAVGPRMNAIAGQSADGVIVHSFMTEQHLREVTLPQLMAGRDQAPEAREEFLVCLPGLVATGGNDQELVAAVEAVRSQIAFYGATPAYRSVLDLHGWGDLHEDLHRLSVSKRWNEMAALVDDDVLETFAAVGSPAEAGTIVRRRFAGVVDRFTLYAPYPMAPEVRHAVVAAARQE